MKKIFALVLSKLSLTSHLFDVLVKPILECGAELWDHTISSSDNPTEIIHHKFCKHTLGVATSGTNLAVYGELGCLPLSISR